MKVANRTGERRGCAPTSLENLRCQGWIGFACICGSIVNVRAAHKVAKMRARREGTSENTAAILDSEGCGLCTEGLKPNKVPKLQDRQHTWIARIQTQDAVLIRKPSAINDEQWCVLGGKNIDSVLGGVTHIW